MVEEGGLLRLSCIIPACSIFQDCCWSWSFCDSYILRRWSTFSACSLRVFGLEAQRTGGRKRVERNVDFLLYGVFARTVTHLGEPLLVGSELGIQLGELDVDRLDAGLEL